MLNPFEFGGFPLWPLAALCVLALLVGLCLYRWDCVGGRLSSEERTACDLGFEHGYQGHSPVEFQSSAVDLAYLMGYSAGEKQRQLRADRKTLDELTGK